MTTEDADPALAPGTMVGAYRIEYRLGAGGVGTVYAAEEPTIKKRVAVKVLRRIYADDAASAARFEREARAANDVRHPGIVDVFAIGKLADGRPYLVMTLLEGKSLREEIAAREKLPPAEAWRIAREIAEALGAAHEAGIVHRDLKPDNVFLERYAGKPARVRVLDFGLAKVEEGRDLEEAQPMKLTRSGVPIGTPAYMAPEQWWTAGIDARTDQYAFGAMLFEMLAGRPPFASQQFVELVQHHLHQTPPKLADVGVALPEAVEAFVARALAKDKDERFASMSELVAAGDAAFATEGPPAEKSGRTPDAYAPTMVGPSAGSTAPARTAPGVGAAPAWLHAALSRWRWLHAALVLLGPLALVAVGYAGDARRNPREWHLMAGWGAWFVDLFFLLGVVLLPVLAARRARTGAASRGAFWLALMPAIAGGLGTYTGWLKIAEIGKSSPSVLPMFLLGMYEANACRFGGFALSSLLFLSVAAASGLTSTANATSTLQGAIGVSRREAIGASALLVAVAVGAAIGGAPSGSIVAGTAAVAIATGALFPALHPDTAARDEIERAVAELLAVGLAIAVGFARVEAREASLWDPRWMPTRAQRAAEIIAADRERTATLLLAVAALALVLIVEGVRLKRLFGAASVKRPTAATWALVATALVAVAADLSFYGFILSTRDHMRSALEPQFSLFARLDPPLAVDVPDAWPHRAPALQIGRDAVAINGRGIAKVSAVESPNVTQTVTNELSRALADWATRPVESEAVRDEEHGPKGEPPDLSVSIDREVPWRSVLALLRLARAAGVVRVEILLTRGEAPVLPRRAPPETGFVLPTDFVPVPAELRDDGLVAGPDEKFGAVAPRLAERLAKEPSVAIATPR